MHISVLISQHFYIPITHIYSNFQFPTLLYIFYPFILFFSFLYFMQNHIHKSFSSNKKHFIFITIIDSTSSGIITLIYYFNLHGVVLVFAHREPFEMILSCVLLGDAHDLFRTFNIFLYLLLHSDNILVINLRN